MPINTIFQLAAHDRDGAGEGGRLVMLPELVAYELTGEAVGERSNAGTTGLLDVATGDWATDLAAAIGVDPQILPPPERAGRVLGEYDGTPVHLVAAHDTACAFAASPLDRDGPRLRLRRHVVHGGRRACAARHLRGSAACELLQRARRSRRFPLPEERPRLLAPRAVRSPVGDERPRPARRCSRRAVRTHLASTSPTNGFSCPGADGRCGPCRRRIDGRRTTCAHRTLGRRVRRRSRRRRRRPAPCKPPVEELVVVGGGADLVREGANRRARRCPRRRRRHRGNPLSVCSHALFTCPVTPTSIRPRRHLLARILARCSACCASAARRGRGGSTLARAPRVDAPQSDFWRPGLSRRSQLRLLTVRHGLHGGAHTGQLVVNRGRRRAALRPCSDGSTTFASRSAT